jgi:hypothetical protein
MSSTRQSSRVRRALALILAASAGSLLTPSHAESISRLTLQASLDGVNWSDDVTFNPNLETSRRVLVRALMTWVGDGTSPTPVGFASLTWQPVFMNVRSNDTIAGFANQGNNNTGGGVTLDNSPLDGPFGRVLPFAATGPTGLSSYSVHTHTEGSDGAPLGRHYRIARNDINRWMGTGPTSGTGGVNNFNGSGGLATVQREAAAATPAVPFVTQINQIVIAQFGLDVGLLAPGETSVINFDAPQAGLSRDPITGQSRALWFGALSDSFGTVATRVEVQNANINLVPAPHALVTLGVMAGAMRRRQRKSNIIRSQS